MTKKCAILRPLTVFTLFAALIVIAVVAVTNAAEPLRIDITYAQIAVQKPPSISPLILPLGDAGLAGVRLAIADNNTTGSFLNHEYRLVEILAEAGDLLRLPSEAKIVVADMPAADLVRLAKENPETLFFNASAEDDELRREQCAVNIFHTAPSRAMKADALAQYLVWKRWRRWFMIRGELPADVAWFDALVRAAKKFNGNIVGVREYAYRATARRTDSGHMQIQKQIPMLTQDADDYDVLLVADESEVFAEYLPFRSWLPRPVAGSAGLRPFAWHAASEQWGGTQLQRRFYKSAGRWMDEIDYNAWLAARAIGEAVTRVGKIDQQKLREHLIGDNFALAGFKGQALTFRIWNQQLRQPIFLASPLMVVSVSPQPGFLHQRTPLDSLGFDLPQSGCVLDQTSNLQ